MMTKETLFYFAAMYEIYNDVPIDIRKEVDSNNFFKKLKHHF